MSSKNLLLVAAVWHIIVGGLIIFIDGRGWCIACRDTILTVGGVVSLIVGVVGLIVGLRGSNPMPGQG